MDKVNAINAGEVKAAKNNSVNDNQELSTVSSERAAETADSVTGLLPCPRCSGGAEVFPEESDTGYYVMCAQPNYPVEECWLSLGEEYDRDGMPEHRFQTKEDAMAAWNVRNTKPDSEQVRRVAQRIIRLVQRASNTPDGELECRAVEIINQEFEAADKTTELK